MDDVGVARFTDTVGRLVLFGQERELTYAVLRTLDYYRTLLWSRRLRRPRGNVGDWPFYRSAQVAMLAITHNYGARFPESDAYTMLEFGVGDGSSFERMLHFRDVLQRRLRVPQKITCVGFDTFGGMPEPRDEDVAAPWTGGEFTFGGVEQVRARLSGYDGFELVPGLFTDTLPAWKERLEREPPLFVSVDCDYYSSTIDVFEHVLPVAPTGSFWYFDDVALFYWSDRVGERRAVREVNEGRFGEHLSFAEYPLHIETGELRHYKQLYRFVNLEHGGFIRASDSLL